MFSSAVGWWCSLWPSTKIKHVKVWKRALTPILSSFPVPRDSGVKNLLLVLRHLYNVSTSCLMFPCEFQTTDKKSLFCFCFVHLPNEHYIHIYVLKANNRTEGCQRIPDETFCMGVNQVLLQEDLKVWRSMPRNKVR